MEGLYAFGVRRTPDFLEAAMAAQLVEQLLGNVLHALLNGELKVNPRSCSATHGLGIGHKSLRRRENPVPEPGIAKGYHARGEFAPPGLTPGLTGYRPNGSGLPPGARSGAVRERRYLGTSENVTPALSTPGTGFAILHCDGGR